MSGPYVSDSIERKTWLDLPPEVIFTILSFLDVADLLQCSRMSHDLREQVFDPVLHQHLPLRMGRRRAAGGEQSGAKPRDPPAGSAERSVGHAGGA